MNRNTDAHFANVPTEDIQRSIMSMPSKVITTGNFGAVLPIKNWEVYPGDSFKIKTSLLIRLQTLLAPVMSDAYADLYYFFVPNRLVWNHWNEFTGEATDSAWLPTTEYTEPKINPPSEGFAVGSIADYLGIPVNTPFVPDGVEGSFNYDHFPSALPFRQYALICDTFFRDSNLTDPLVIPMGDAMQTGTNGDSYKTDVANGGKPFVACKRHDYFTSCLPSAQRGQAVEVPVPSGFHGVLPVQYMPDVTMPWYDMKNPVSESFLRVYDHDGNLRDQTLNLQWNTGTNVAAFGQTPASPGTSSGSSVWSVGLDHLGIDIPQVSTTSFNINDLRLAFAAQRFLERKALYGDRYISFLKAYFGVTSPDARLQRPEYLGGKRIPINIHTVTNTAQTGSADLGDVGAMSYTVDVDDSIDWSATEHGRIFCCLVMRYDHYYSQGLHRSMTRNHFTDYYVPTFAHIGEQPVYTSELYCDGRKPDVFGFQEAWAELRYAPDTVTGQMRPGINGSLASWHFGDYYTQKPTLSDEWIREDKTNVDRTLAVTSQLADQCLIDAYFDTIATRAMPVYSVPGLIDHG